MKSKTLMSPTLMLLEDTNVSSSYIHLCYPKTLMSPALMLLEDTNGLQLVYTLMLLEDINVSSSYLLEDINVSSSYIHLCYPKTLMSPALMLLEDTNGLQLVYTLMLPEDINVSNSYAT